MERVVVVVASSRGFRWAVVNDQSIDAVMLMCREVAIV
jgi:hypothetical protein